MELALAPGDIARLVCGAGYQDHLVKIIDVTYIYISATPNGTDDALSVLVSKHATLLDIVGEVYAFGDGRFGQLGLKNNTSRKFPTPIPDLPTQSIAAGAYHTSLGDVYAFGDNEFGKLGLGIQDHWIINVPTLIPNLVARVKKMCDSHFIYVCI